MAHAELETGVAARKFRRCNEKSRAAARACLGKQPAFQTQCTKNKDEVSRLGRECARPCNSDGTCLRTGHSCICDDICGESCIPVERENYCDPALLSTSHATYTVNLATAKFGSIAQYTCADGFFPAGGDNERTCTGGGGWSGNALICNPENACYDPPVVEHASHNGSKEYYLAGELLVYSCDFGYYRGNSIPLLMCQQIGDSAAWGNFKMSCSPKSCGYPGNIDHGRIEGSVYSFLSSVTYVCDIGYKILGIATRYCQANQKWSGYLPQCIPVTCRTLSAPENGKTIGSNHGYDDEVSFICNDGFILNGVSNLRCQHDGTWSSPTPTCKAISEVCHMPQHPLNGQWVTGSNCRDGQYQLRGCQLSYTCNRNYIPVNSSVVYVCSEPEWDKREEPLCEPDACYNPPIVEHASHNGSKEYYFPGEVLFYSCHFGYYGGNSIPLTCEKSSNLATWENFEMTCSRKIFSAAPTSACYDPPVVAYASHNGSKEYYLAGELLVYSCDFGYYRGNSIPLLMCQQAGDTVAWGNLNMTCLPKSCGHPGNIQHGEIEGSAFIFNTSVTYACDRGYKIQGTAIRHCQADQEWSGNLPQCIPVECRNLLAPGDGKIIGSNHSYNDEVSFSCNDGFMLDGESTLRCQHDGTWSSPPPTCNELCSMPKDPTNGRWIKGSNCRDGQYQLRGCQLSYTCNEEYVPVNTSVVYICSEPEWEQTEEPLCKPELCSMPKDPINGQWVKGSGCQDGQDQFPECELSYTCNEEYVPANTSVVYVCSEPEWDQMEEPLCKPDACYDPPPVVENASHNGSKEYYWARELLFYTCDDGYYRSGISIPLLMCQKKGNTVAWGDFDMTCLRKIVFSLPF
ncbi:CUB and sushi domain-containing protein 1 [Holothuria leucospilota]|uniref:CUB and sushi domain-containing protein 1 n=1 Tax=Holothuria leucospilota TaxID=206669 RepID=A0A9Q1C5E5_HOLLE|nr:CUB and sushi domain-containing protein 1 [Holothuria leucospilota]